MKESDYSHFKRNDFLEKLKEILNFQNTIEDIDKNILGHEYVITIDNFMKIILIYYRIILNINVILMGDTCYGKTLLITKLNNEKTIDKKFKLNIHGGYIDEQIIERIEEINENGSEEDNNKIWVFIDEIKTCKSMGIFKEIIFNNFGREKIEKKYNIFTVYYLHSYGIIHID